MKLNFFTKQLSIVGRFLATGLLCLLVMISAWQGAFFSNISALADSTTNLIASADLGNKVKEKASEDAGRAKGFIRDTADRVEQTAKKNAARIDQATDDNGSFVERRAYRDTARIEKRAEEDADRTQKAVDKTKNVVKRTVDNIKDAF
jgi:ElaB/YqjD/DUF883 family membrane-anchored ribosome-binding protein